MQDADFGEDVEFGKLVGGLVGAVGVAQGCFRYILAACIFVIVVVADVGQWGVLEQWVGERTSGLCAKRRI